MSSGPSYPSPTAVQVGGGAAPFYGQNGGSPSQLPADLQRLQQADLSQDTSMMMAASMNGAEHYADHEIPMDDSMGGPTSPERLAQGVLNMEQGDVMATSAARKRSKVSRACDECRRKKVRRRDRGIMDRHHVYANLNRFDVTRLRITLMIHAQAAGGRMSLAASVGSP